MASFDDDPEFRKKQLVALKEKFLAEIVRVESEESGEMASWKVKVMKEKLHHCDVELHKIDTLVKFVDDLQREEHRLSREKK